MNYFFPAAIIFLAVTTGCGSSSSENEDTTTTKTETPVTTAPADTTQNPGIKTTPPASIPAPVINNTIQQAPVITSTAGLNPEHGKPGHRCDIAVGAPLDSKPTTQIQPSISTTNTPIVNGQKSAPVVSAPVITPVKTPAGTTPVGGPGLNPEHGKPGHRCDIAVGAPLDSKPVSATTKPAETVTPSIVPTTPTIQPTPTPTPAPSISPAGNTSGAGLNPEHGKPGHRCDIAVGAPLNSQPVQKQKE
jgi:hypothetical protein